MSANRRRAGTTARRSVGGAPPVGDIVFPANSGIVNVKNGPYNAVGNGVADDTAALLAAFTANDYKDADTSRPHIERPAARTVYLPAGTYRVTGSLTIPGSSVRIVGAGEGRTIIKLDDGASGFGSAASPQYLLRTGEAGANGQENAGFANYIHHLTLDVGANNPGAIGCRYSVANSGSMRHVTIKSSDATKRGLYGLMFGTTSGPGYVADVTVDGFEHGIYSETSHVNDIVFSDITLTNQRATGVRCTAKSLVFEGLLISGAPVAIDLTNAAASIMVDGLSMTGPGSGPAIKLVANAYAWVRDVTASGWTNLITQGATARFTGRTSITEWGAANYRRGNTSTAWGENSAYVGLNLPNQRPPEFEQSDLTKWKCPQDFGYTSGNVGPTLQQAIDSGAEVVYLPYGRYTLSTAVTVDHAVRKLEGMFSVLERLTGGSLTVGNNTSGHPIIIQDLVPDGSLTTVHASSNTVVVRDYGNRNPVTAAVVSTTAAATGNLFYESAGANQHLEITRPINAWVRQMNREHGSCDISGGATVRIFGDNMEVGAGNEEGVITATNSTLEVIGAAFDILSRTDVYGTVYGFTAIDSTISVIDSGYLQSSDVPRWVSDVKNGSSVGQVLAAHEYQATTGTNRRVIVPMYRSP